MIAIQAMLKSRWKELLKQSNVPPRSYDKHTIRGCSAVVTSPIIRRLHRFITIDLRRVKMRKRFVGFSIALALFTVFASAAPFIAQTRNRPTSASGGDIKVKYRVTMAGQASESTTMIKGPRERSENSGYGN